MVISKINHNVHTDQKETYYASFFKAESNMKYCWIPYKTIQIKMSYVWFRLILKNLTHDSQVLKKFKITS